MIDKDHRDISYIDDDGCEGEIYNQAVAHKFKTFGEL
jgi:hypothetical protein